MKKKKTSITVSINSLGRFKNKKWSASSKIAILAEGKAGAKYVTNARKGMNSSRFPQRTSFGKGKASTARNVGDL